MVLPLANRRLDPALRCAALAVANLNSESCPQVSPTFVLANEYRERKSSFRFMHLDDTAADVIPSAGVGGVVGWILGVMALHASWVSLT